MLDFYSLTNYYNTKRWQQVTSKGDNRMGGNKVGRKFKVLSLFDGMSCGQIALDNIGLSASRENLEYYASEIKLHGIAVTQSNYPDTIQLGDVTKVSFKDGSIS